jgi:FdhD protein
MLEVSDKSLKNIRITKFNECGRELLHDEVSVEEPLEIRLDDRQIAVTMRTPGDDRELAIGFLFTEGILSEPGDVSDVIIERCNVVNVRSSEGVWIDEANFSRHSFVASSCGVCGKKSIAAVRVKRIYECVHEMPTLMPAILVKLPDTLRAQQSHFERTGGIHASCLFDVSGNLLGLKEDVGRHNALDKLLGAKFLAGGLPLTEEILMVSGRASFELVQKAAHAGIPVLAAVGAPSSLAVQLAEECDMTLIGFLRDRRFNVYSGAHRIHFDALRK